MEIKVLGPGCAKCKTIFGIIQRVVNDNNLDATVTKVEDIMEIMNYNIISTPAVVVDGEVKIKGHVPTESEIRKILGL
ncbi:MAG: thioredoxin family protein [Bacteroidales bacterium]|nr:thioredoxin family protein [Bacteroidales bacterium]